MKVFPVSPPSMKGKDPEKQVVKLPIYLTLFIISNLYKYQAKEYYVMMRKDLPGFFCIINSLIIILIKIFITLNIN
jgi:hypothetical protein